ncbi:hypothetical protein PVAP13_2NG155003 [Panicum virgatum]|uniref:Uncharacterized protein n=1 Tax=Panicum virgatum TaxID=38727 RepID=A0A8T0VNW5_PANVG|nr:hypothetical protein PVAP13_2NG155003 [Panicum virgatum]
MPPLSEADKRMSSKFSTVVGVCYHQCWAHLCSARAVRNYRGCSSALPPLLRPGPPPPPLHSAAPSPRCPAMAPPLGGRRGRVNGGRRKAPPARMRGRVGCGQGGVRWPSRPWRGLRRARRPPPLACVGGEEAREDPLRGLLGSRLQEGAGAPAVAGGEAGAAGEGPAAAGGGAEVEEVLGAGRRGRPGGPLAAWGAARHHGARGRHRICRPRLCLWLGGARRARARRPPPRNTSASVSHHASSTAHRRGRGMEDARAARVVHLRSVGLRCTTPLPRCRAMPPPPRASTREGDGGRARRRGRPPPRRRLPRGEQ